MHIEPEHILYTKVKVADVPAIVEKTLKNGEIIEELLYRNPATGEHCKGNAEIPFQNRQHRLVMKNCMIEPENIAEYINDLAKNDGQISEILKQFGMERNVCSIDRQMYNTWVDTWQINNELIALAVERSIGMSMPMQYLNKLLSTFYSKKIVTKEDAEKYLKEKTSYTKERSGNVAKNAKGAEYSKEQLNSLMDNLFEVEI